MTDISSLASAASAGVVNSKVDKAIRQATAKDSKIEKSAAEFESILLGNWLQQAEQSFGSLPGGEEDDDDPGKQQYQGMAMECLGTSMTAAGGIGIAKMIAKELHKAEDARVPLAR